jgi:hypothetical protein
VSGWIGTAHHHPTGLAERGRGVTHFRRRGGNDGVLRSVVPNVLAIFQKGVAYLSRPHSRLVMPVSAGVMLLIGLLKASF